MRTTGLLTLILLGGAGVCLAQERQFPYEALCDVDNEEVRCGPGPKYYATDRLKRGATVMVHRHDPGGWAMIAPPPGSFSYIQSEYVQKASSGRGTVTVNNVVVHVGSVIGPDRGVYQRTLSKGDAVEVLGEETFATERGPVTMYKIKPPAREYRWIAGRALLPGKGGVKPATPNQPRPLERPVPFIQGPVAQDTDMEVAAEEDLFGQPPSVADAGPPQMPAGGGIASLPVSTQSSTDTTSPADTPELEVLRQELAQIDSRFRQTLLGEPTTWDLESLRQSYQSLEQRAGHPAFTSHVQQRLATIQRYARIQGDYVDFYRLTSQTQQRDRELAARQKEQELALKNAETSGTTSPPTTMASLPRSPGDPGATNQRTTAVPASQPASLPATSTASQSRQGQPAQTSGTPASPRDGQPQPAIKFSGAGIVQRSSIPAAGVPPYMLIAPDGRLLAYLDPAPGIDLSQVQNQSLGILGERGYREELKADVIVVRGYRPVMLRTGNP